MQCLESWENAFTEFFSTSQILKIFSFITSPSRKRGINLCVLKFKYFKNRLKCFFLAKPKCLACLVDLTQPKWTTRGRMQQTIGSVLIQDFVQIGFKWVFNDIFSIRQKYLNSPNYGLMLHLECSNHLWLTSDIHTIITDMLTRWDLVSK